MAGLYLSTNEWYYYFNNNWQWLIDILIHHIMIIHHIRRCRMLEIEELSFFFERIITQSLETRLCLHFIPKCTNCNVYCTLGYDEYVSRIAHNNQPPLGVKIIKVSRCANCIRCIIFYELPAY